MKLLASAFSVATRWIDLKLLQLSDWRWMRAFPPRFRPLRWALLAGAALLVPAFAVPVATRERPSYPYCAFQVYWPKPKIGDIFLVSSPANHLRIK